MPESGPGSHAPVSLPLTPTYRPLPSWSRHFGCHQGLEVRLFTGTRSRFGLWVLSGPSCLPGLPAPRWRRGGTMSGPGRALPPPSATAAALDSQSRRGACHRAALEVQPLKPRCPSGQGCRRHPASLRPRGREAGKEKRPHRQRWPRRPGDGPWPRPRPWLRPRPASQPGGSPPAPRPPAPRPEDGGVRVTSRRRDAGLVGGVAPGVVRGAERGDTAVTLGRSGPWKE